MLSRKYNTALSVVVSAMASASFLGTMPSGAISAGAGAQIMPAILQEATASAQAAGWTAPSESATRPIATPPAAAIVPPKAAPSVGSLTDAEINKIDAYLKKYEKDTAVDPTIAALLGISKPGESYMIRELSGHDGNDKMHVHYFCRSVTNPNAIIFMYLDRTTLASTGYWTDAKLKFVTGFAWDKQLEKLSAASGTAGLESELTWWAKNIAVAPDLP